MSVWPVRPWALSRRLTLSLPQHSSPGTQDGLNENNCCLNEWQWLLRLFSSRKAAPVRVGEGSRDQPGAGLQVRKFPGDGGGGG